MSSQPNEPGAETTLSAVPEAERETIIVIPGDRSEVSVWTNIPKHVRAFRKRAVTSNTVTAPTVTSNTDNPAPSTTTANNPTTTTDHPAMTTYAEPVPKVRELRSGFHGATEWADFRIAERDYSPERGVKRNSNLSPEQRAAAGERLRANKKRSVKPLT